MEIQLWREILNPYELAVKELTDKFNHLIREHKVKNLYSPIESVSGRVKSVTSILEKMQKKQIAIEQLEEWARRSDVTIVERDRGSDTASAMPPFAVPSSLVMMMPSRSSASLNMRACERPF